jgi:hypothetical protein
MRERPVLTLAPVTAPSQTVDPATHEPTQAPEASAQQPATPKVPPAAKNGRRSSGAQKPATPAHTAPREQESTVWRRWGPFHQTVSFKWPPELVAELDDRRYELREPVGLMVVAAITYLLDQDDDAIRALIDRAEQAKPRAGRPRRRSP